VRVTLPDPRFVVRSRNGKGKGGKGKGWEKGGRGQKIMSIATPSFG